MRAVVFAQKVIATMLVVEIRIDSIRTMETTGTSVATAIDGTITESEGEEVGAGNRSVRRKRNWKIKRKVIVKIPVKKMTPVNQMKRSHGHILVFSRVINLEIISTE